MFLAAYMSQEIFGCCKDVVYSKAEGEREKRDWTDWDGKIY